MLNGGEDYDVATSGDSNAVTIMLKSKQKMHSNVECAQTQSASLEDQELSMGNEFRSMHSMDFKFYISELSLKYNNHNIAATFNLSLKQVREWRKHNMLLKQAYYEKNVAVKEKITKPPVDFEFSSSPVAFCSTTKLQQYSTDVEPPNSIMEQPALIDTVKPTSTSKTRKKSSYCSEYKLKAVAFAEISTNRAAAREFNVHEKRIREWRKNKEILINSPKDCRRLKGAGRKPLLNHQIEEALYNWIITTANERITITKIELQQKALELSQKNIPEAKFTASSAWVEGFLKRHSLSVKDHDDLIADHVGSYSAPTMVVEEAEPYNFETQMKERNEDNKQNGFSALGVDKSSSSTVPYAKEI